MSSDEFSCGVNYDVGAVLDRTNEVWSAESVVDDKRNVVTVGDFGDFVDVEDVGVGVAESFSVEASSGGCDSVVDGLEVAEVDYCVVDTLCLESVGDEVV